MPIKIQIAVSNCVGEGMYYFDCCEVDKIKSATYNFEGKEFWIAVDAGEFPIPRDTALKIAEFYADTRARRIFDWSLMPRADVPKTKEKVFATKKKSKARRLS